ncbi:hypothetical protein SAMN05216567_113122 [Variovorax sp. OK605]|uniref:hypothetical protein n=1 Tax=Variovorax sp. OK605 TaxID=1855317 RepID=UPI0008E90D3A|nr:hypothetical protein [Variovorax sp. OK605]SFQ29732.1 hypothetical protein SAMN05216567_113122 [Variovorax sp. OK605]
MNAFMPTICSSTFLGACHALTARGLRVLEALRRFRGADAEVLCEARDRSLHKLILFARTSSLPGCSQLLCSPV